MARVDLKTVQELIGQRVTPLTTRLSKTHKLRELESGQISAQSGYKLAANAKKLQGLQNRITFNLLNLNELNQM